MSEANYLSVNKDGKISAYVGQEATRIPAAIALGMSIRLWVKTKIIPTEGFGIGKMLKMAKSFTGVVYKRSEADKAAEDLLEWAQARKNELPVEYR